MKSRALTILTTAIATALWVSMLTPAHAEQSLYPVLDRIARALERANQLTDRGCK